MLARAKLQLTGPDGRAAGAINIRCRPGRETRFEADLIVQPTDQHQVELLEESEYLYDLELPRPVTDIRLEPQELFDPDDASGLRGRIKTTSYVGTVPVRVFEGERPWASSEFEVRSSKLSYETDFRRMLNAIASEGAELLMQRFAPAMTRFSPLVEESAKVLYQRFTFLQSVVAGESFSSAIQEILKRPHHVYEDEVEYRPPGRGAKGTSLLGREFGRSGPKTPWAGGLFANGMIPHRLGLPRFEATADTEPNRFVRFVLKHWRATCVEIRERLQVQDRGSPILRGLRETTDLINQLDQILGYPLFREVGELRQLPLANLTLLKREGYREILRLFAESEAAASFRWEGAEDVFGAGQRDVSTLYEYWVYLQLRKILAKLCTSGLSLEPLFEESPDGLVMSLRRGRARVLAGRLERLGRSLTIQLWFNRRFRFDHGIRSESWTRDMQPDCSVRISAYPAIGQINAETWLHFDAKYRVERITELFGDEETSEEAEISVERRADLLKMHAYRDAIRRSSGAYVIFPGEASRDPTDYRRYQEILPGLGAFALHPGLDGNAEQAGSWTLSSFLEAVLTHVASQASQRERAEYWEDVAYGAELHPTFLASPFLIQPPADTRILLGYVKSPEQLAWIQRTGLYNLRADQRTGSIQVDSSALGADFVLLYGLFMEDVILCRRVEDPILLAREEMFRRGYPDPGGELYCCLRLGETFSTPHQMPPNLILELALELAGPDARMGTPAMTSWQRVMNEIEDRLNRSNG